MIAACSSTIERDAPRLQPPAGERGEEGLDGIEPGAGGRGEVEGPARVPGEPGADLGMLVGGVVVEDHVDQLAGRHRALDALRKRMNSWWRWRAMQRPTTRAVEHVERGEQRGRAVALVVVMGCTSPARVASTAVSSWRKRRQTRRPRA